MIIGIGVDVIEIARIQQSIERFGDRFLTKIFTPDEIRFCAGRTGSARHFAAQFAAKEAVSKAMATGNAGDFEWRNVEVVYDETGKPEFRFYGVTKNALHGCGVFLSLSYSDNLVSASVIIEKNF